MSTLNPTDRTEPGGNLGTFGGLPPERFAHICKSMGHPVRIQIIEFLKNEKKCFCGQIVNRLPLAQSTVSQHLKNLKDAGVIIGEVDGPGTCYCLNRPLLKQFRNSMTQFLG